MKAKIRLYQNDGEKEQGFPVKVILSHNRKTRRKTISYSKDYDWNTKDNLPLPSHPDYEALYDTITNVKKLSAKAEFTRLSDFETAYTYILGSEKEHPDFFAYGESRAVYMEEKGRFGNARAYRIALKQLKDYNPNVRELTKDILEGFKESKREFKNTTIKNYLVELRAIYNSGVPKVFKKEDLFTGLFTDIPVKKRRAKNRYLSIEDLKKLQGLNLKPSYQRAVDLSLLQFYLCGADLTDIYHLKKEDVIGNRVILTRNKLGNKAYEFDVLLNDKAKAIIEKYTGEGKDVFPWKKDPQAYITFRNNHNRNLKIIQKREEIVLKPKNNYLTTKVMRHTFATLGKFARVEEDLLRELMGHERNDIDTAYKDKYPEADRDKAQLLITTI